MDPRQQAHAERPILADVRPARWSLADSAAYEAVHQLADEAMSECLSQEAAVRNASLPDLREAGRWQRVRAELTEARAALRPERREAVRELKERCLELLDQIVQGEGIRAALAVGRATALTPGREQVRHGDVWWIRSGPGYVQASEEIAAVLDRYSLILSAADAAVRAEAKREG